MTVATATLRIGTRASRLARAQSQAVADRLVASTGAARRAGRRDHPRRRRRLPAGRRSAARAFSCRPCAAPCSPARSTCACTRSRTSRRPRPRGSSWRPCPSREDPRDVVVGRDGLTLAELPAGSRSAPGRPDAPPSCVLSVSGSTSSTCGATSRPGCAGCAAPRRLAGSVGDLDAVVLARAGLARLGRLDEITEVLDPLQMLPAPGQGALAVECRAGDPVAADVRAVLDDALSRAAVDRRAGVPGRRRGRLLGPRRGPGRARLDRRRRRRGHRRAVAARGGGRRVGEPLLRHSATGAPRHPEAVGRSLADHMLAEGAAELIGAARRARHDRDPLVTGSQPAAARRPTPRHQPLSPTPARHRPTPPIPVPAEEGCRDQQHLDPHQQLHCRFGRRRQARRAGQLRGHRPR